MTLFRLEAGAVDADRIIIKRNKGNEKDEYKLLKFKRSNQGTSINQKPIVKVGEEVESAYLF